ncbi:hypothetical protein [Streptomyces radicis]|uniref:Peptidase n=1 Tax=Streptomyces radicis TaxID=1750517 RepID=A0A3A9W195_9ACTN|nr:hypothetical protein [Streptomyces radicis]RKN07031.1 hypothetical protein D7319_20275 [Streptomyces radicis]RKN15092.1 hypothetical protein D7318_28145 [Streptomyces radicis]
MRHPRVAAAALVGALFSATLFAAGPALAAAPSGGGIGPGGDLDAESCAEFTRYGPLDIELTGIPEPVVAGEWTEFTYRVTNTYDHPVDRLYAFVELGAYDTSGGADIAVKAQRFAHGAWRPLGAIPEADPEEGPHFPYLGRTGALDPGESAEARLRIRVHGGAPEGALGTAGLAATWADDATGVCESTVTDLEFDVAAAG